MQTTKIRRWNYILATTPLNNNRKQLNKVKTKLHMIFNYQKHEKETEKILAIQ